MRSEKLESKKKLRISTVKGDISKLKNINDLTKSNFLSSDLQGVLWKSEFNQSYDQDLKEVREEKQLPNSKEFVKIPKGQNKVLNLKSYNNQANNIQNSFREQTKLKGISAESYENCFKDKISYFKLFKAGGTNGNYSKLVKIKQEDMVFKDSSFNNNLSRTFHSRQNTQEDIMANSKEEKQQDITYGVLNTDAHIIDANRIVDKLRSESIK